MCYNDNIGVDKNMKNKGFTLIELLAVIVILAIIALIAVPQILHIIEESKIKSLEISTSEYIRAVNISLMNKEINENVSDGLYTITDDGKKIVLGDKEIDIEYEGKGLKSGQLLIEDSKVIRVLKGLIDNYYARVNGDEVTILKSLNENTLVDGKTFNAAIKNLVKDTDGTDATHSTVDKTVTKIEFLQDGVLPEGYMKDTLEELPNVDLSKAGNGSIKGYYNEETGEIYVYSDGYISFSSANNMFFLFQSVEEIEFNLVDTSKVTTMSYMFYGCSSLTTLDLSSFDTSSVTDMYMMFYDCSKLTTLDLTSFDTNKVTSMIAMFRGCSNLKEIKGIEKFNTSNVTSMGSMFYGYKSLTTLELGSFDTKNVKNDGMNSMFAGCSSLTILNLSNFDTSKLTSMSSMFSNCSKLTTLDLTSFDTSSVTNVQNMFYGCSSLTSIKVTTDKWTLDTSLLNDTKTKEYTSK